MRESFRGLLQSLTIVAALAAGACAGGDAHTATPAGGGGRGRGGDQAVPVTVAPVVQKSMPIEIRVIGAVFNKARGDTYGYYGYYGHDQQHSQDRQKPVPQ